MSERLRYHIARGDVLSTNEAAAIAEARARELTKYVPINTAAAAACLRM